MSVAKGRDVARKLGWQCQADGGTFNDDRDQIAQAYGYSSYATLPKALRSEALREYVRGKREEREAA